MYGNLARRLVQEKLKALESERPPEFRLGMPTIRIIRLHQEYSRAAAVMKRCKDQLDRLGACVDNGDLELSYKRRSQLQRDWNQRQGERIRKCKALRNVAELALIDVNAKTSKVEIVKLQKKLAAL